MMKPRTSWLALVLGSVFLCTVLLTGSYAIDDGSNAPTLQERYETLYRKLTDTIANQPGDPGLPTLREEVLRAKAAWKAALAKLQIKVSVQAPTATGTPTVPGATTSVALPGFKKPESINGDNYCGQYAMTSVLQSFGCPVTAQEVYDATNPGGIFTAPPTIIEYLNSQGVKAKQRQGADLADIKRNLDAKIPVIVLVNCGGTPHWVCISGYHADAAGRITSLELRDSYWAINKPTGTSEMPVAEFLSNWKQPCTGRLGQFVSYSNLMVDITGVDAAQKKVPVYSGTFPTALEDAAAGAINDLYTGWKKMDFFALGGGVVKALGAIPAALSNLSGRGLGWLGDRLAAWGTRNWNEGGLGGKVLGGVGLVGGTALKAAGWVGKTAGNVLASAGTLLGNGIKMLGSVFR